MNYIYGRSAARMMMAAALLVRLFVGMAVDFPVALNAAWMCPILGFVIYLPLGLAIVEAMKAGNTCAWGNISDAVPRMFAKIAELLFALLLAWDAAVNVRLMASSSNIIALGDTTVHLLILPLGAVAAAIVLLGGDALGNGARIALRILPLFALIVLMVQLPGYRSGWLTPLLGEGIEGIARGSIYCAGCMALLSLIWLPALPDRNKGGFTKYIALPALGAAALLLTQQMSFPVMPGMEFTRAARIELVLSNGRMSLYPQFILNLLWFGGLLFLLSSETAASAVWLRSVLPGVKIWVLALAESGVIVASAIFNPVWMKDTAPIIQMLFPVLAGLLAVLLIGTVLSDRREKTCKKQV